MNKFKKMNASQLAKFIMSKDVDDIFSFGDNFDAELQDDELNKDNISDWYGIQKITLFDGLRVVAGKWGMGAIGIFDVENTDEYLAEDIQHFFNSYGIGGIVAVETDIFDSDEILEEDLEEYLLAHGYDVYDDVDDIKNRTIDSPKVSDIAYEMGFHIVDPESERHDNGFIFERMK